MGTFAEYLSVWAPALVKIPALLRDQEAPLACGGLTAYGAVKKLVKHGVVPGRPIAVVGAAGGLGHYAVQIATAFGYEVVGVDVGAERLDFVKSLGAARARRERSARRGPQRARRRRRQPRLLGKDGRLPAGVRAARTARAHGVRWATGDERGQHR